MQVLEKTSLNLFEFDNNFDKAIIGTDEAGRGPLAGPVVVAAVIMPEDSFLEGVNDSKKVSQGRREKLYPEIKAAAIAQTVLPLPTSPETGEKTDKQKNARRR